jgi:hypothetical protein
VDENRRSADVAILHSLFLGRGVTSKLGSRLSLTNKEIAAIKQTAKALAFLRLASIRLMLRRVL